MKVLDKIKEPADLKSLTLPELDQLAAEIRAEVVNTVTKTGGHLASSLGAVELSIALHRVFDSPRDKVIWDVGHQSYAHKLLTGRREMFDTLRQYHGLSGFPDPAESPHDAFGTGHASTSVSASLGIAIARDMAGEDFHVIAIIGDGAMTGGMSLEGLNQTGHLGTRMIVVLNDNAMAISPSVGAISQLLNKIRLDPRYYRAKEEAKRLIHKMPRGASAWKWAKRFKVGVKEMILPTQIWDALGFKYIGPVDGHNIARLEEALEKAREYSNGPVLVHVITTKGKGYEPAEGDSIKFHGVSGKINASSGFPSYSEVFGQTMLRLFREDKKLVAISAAMMDGTCLKSIAEEFPGRVFDVGICEQHAVTFAAGLATQGYIPIVAIYSTFLQRAFDQVLHDVCIQNLPVVFALDRAGIVGEDGKTHQGNFDLSYLGCIPNLVIAAPSDENELRNLLYTAVKCGHPMAIRYPRGSAPGLPIDENFRELPIGKGEVINEGDDVAILAIGSAVNPSIEAAKILSDKVINCSVVNARFAKPLDAELILKLASKTKRLVTVEENTLVGGFGSAVLSLLSDATDIRVLRLGIPDEFVEHGPQDILRASYSIDAEGIARSIISFFPELSHHTPQTKAKR
ncbi:MAG TPA: 1-deoxy-D-xylulose-5-phosphate synthase [Dehalococcoidia bacterium]|nr:1-deoxy-D-xylulose-5-phosphate synthase [Dehalococcoidia bacterium]